MSSLVPPSVCWHFCSICSPPSQTLTAFICCPHLLFSRMLSTLLTIVLIMLSSISAVMRIEVTSPMSPSSLSSSSPPRHTPTIATEDIAIAKSSVAKSSGYHYHHHVRDYGYVEDNKDLFIQNYSLKKKTNIYILYLNCSLRDNIHSRNNSFK